MKVCVRARARVCVWACGRAHVCCVSGKPIKLLSRNVEMVDVFENIVIVLCEIKSSFLQANYVIVNDV